MNKELKEAVEQIKVEITLSELPDKLLFGIETLITFVENLPSEKELFKIMRDYDEYADSISLKHYAKAIHKRMMEGR